MSNLSPSRRNQAIEWSDGAAGPLLTLLQDLTTPSARPELDWQDQALCAEVDPEIFFPEKGGNPRIAKAVCRACHVRAECLNYALEHDERFGIYGGLSERERRRLKREQRQEAA